VRRVARMLAAVGLVLGTGDGLAAQNGPCVQESFEGARYLSCTFDPARTEFAVHHGRADGTAHGSVRAFIAAQAAAGTVPTVAMNGGMYHADLSPVGLYVEDGRERMGLVTSDGPGNFHLKPNGVFFVTEDGEPGVLETKAFAEANLSMRHATQSGPMLVIDGAIHPRILPNGSTRFIRNGVGVTVDGSVVFAVSLDRVSFGNFARFFRDHAGARNALFLDGKVSALAIGPDMQIGSWFPAGPILAAYPKAGGD
jgi:uncharacterized protein YigE (DUF2233 family)